MREFFRGWRRKLGCLLLILATATATAWCRSLIVRDQLIHVSGSTMRQITSESGILSWETSIHFEDFFDSAIPESGWFSRPATETGHDGYRGLCQWRFAWGGFDLATGTFGRSQIYGGAVPYWSMTIPLTLASAYLILWQPRRCRRRQVVPESALQAQCVDPSHQAQGAGTLPNRGPSTPEQDLQ